MRPVASQRFLTQLGAWNLMSAQRISPVQAMEVHGDGGGCLNLHAWQDAQDYLAWIVESGQMECSMPAADRRPERAPSAPTNKSALTRFCPAVGAVSGLASVWCALD